MPAQLIPLVALGFTAGVMSGMFGIGGGIIIVPALTILLGFDLTAATGTSLVVLMLPVSFFAVLAYYRAGKLELLPALLIAAGLAAGSFFGAEIALNIDVKGPYGLFVLYMSWRFIEPRQLWGQWRGKPRADLPAPDGQHRAVSPYVLLLTGLGAGVLAGMFGIGGGIIIVPALIFLLNFDQKEATGTSLAALLPPVGLPAVLRYAQEGKVDALAALPIAFGVVIGAVWGARLALGLSATTVKRAYGVFLLFVGIRFLLGDMLYHLFNAG